MEVVQDTTTLPALPTCTFSASPTGSPISWTIDGNTYPEPGQPQRFEYIVGQELTFTAQTWVPDGVRIVKYQWDFGDQTEGYGSVVKHTFNSVNRSARISLCVTDNYDRKVCSGQTMPFIKGTTVNIVPEVIVMT
jgi:hypothetical protein